MRCTVSVVSLLGRKTALLSTFFPFSPTAEVVSRSPKTIIRPHANHCIIRLTIPAAEFALPASDHRYGVDELCRVQDRLYGEDCFTIYCFFIAGVSVAVFVLPVNAYLDFIQIIESHAAPPLVCSIYHAAFP